MLRIPLASLFTTPAAGQPRSDSSCTIPSSTAAATAAAVCWMCLACPQHHTGLLPLVLQPRHGPGVSLHVSVGGPGHSSMQLGRMLTCMDAYVLPAHHHHTTTTPPPPPGVPSSRSCRSVRQPTLRCRSMSPSSCRARTSRKAARCATNQPSPGRPCSLQRTRQQTACLLVGRSAPPAAAASASAPTHTRDTNTVPPDQDSNSTITWALFWRQLTPLPPMGPLTFCVCRVLCGVCRADRMLPPG